jgi:sugar O-acyltransferase (sialic acid O-acetyltransferase NeuD family)
MKKRLVIVGCGNVGGFISYNSKEVDDFEIIGFLDDDPEKDGKVVYGHKVLGGIDMIRSLADRNLSVAIAISSPAAKVSVLSRLKQYPLEYPNFIFRTTWISKNVAIGKGVILYPGVSINYESTIGDFVIANMNCAIGHNTTISDCCTLAPGVNLAGFTYLEECVEVGIGACTRQNARVGKNAVVGGQSMVVSDVPSGAVVKGIPAKQYRK